MGEAHVKIASSKSRMEMESFIRSLLQDVRALEYAVYRLTYGEENLPPEEPGPGG